MASVFEVAGLFSRDRGIRMTLWSCEAIGEFPKKWFYVRDHSD
jgi:hypothetical protein